MCTYFKIETHVTQNLIDDFFEALYAELNERPEAATSSYSATDEFLQYIYSLLMVKNNRKVRSRCLVHQFSFADIFNQIYFCLHSLKNRGNWMRYIGHWK